MIDGDGITVLVGRDSILAPVICATPAQTSRTRFSISARTAALKERTLMPISASAGSH